MPREKLLRKLPHRIGDILVRLGYVTPDAIEKALEIQRSSTVKRVGEILKERGQVTDEQIARALAEQFQLPFLDLVTLPDGWELHRAIYNFKCKHLKMLPMRDPDQRIWFVLSDVTEDEKMAIQISDLTDPLSIRFAVAASSAQTQTLDENLTDEELKAVRSVQPVELPAVPAWVVAHREGRDEPRPAGADLELLGLAEAPGEEAATPDRIRECLDAAARRVPRPLHALGAPRLMEALGALWSCSPEELRGWAGLEFRRGPSLALEILQVAPTEHSGELPVGYVPASSVRAGCRVSIRVTLPWSSAEEGDEDVDWPTPWPPPDLEEAFQPLTDRLCVVPSFLKSSQDSLRWMGNRGTLRESLNDLTIRTVGVTLDHARIPTIPGFWAAVKARVRSLQANHVARQDWARWKEIQNPQLELTPGHILAFCAMALREEPRALPGSLEVRVRRGPIHRLELQALEPGTEGGRRHRLDVISPLVA